MGKGKGRVKGKRLLVQVKRCRLKEKYECARDDLNG